ncbi:copper chaperone PCu(A)C [Sulfitobacter sp. LCG007]
MNIINPVLAACLCLAGGIAQAEIVIRDAYVRSSAPGAPVGAAFMVIENTSEVADRLVAATSPAATRTELHTHQSEADGVMKMIEVEGGLEIPAEGSHDLRRGGDHVMLMGLTKPLPEGGSVPLTLSFERAGDVTIDVPVDLDR